MTVGVFQTPRPHGGPKVMTVVRIVTLGGPIPVTVGTFETRGKHEKAKSNDSYKDGSFEASKSTTVARIATSRGPIL